MATCAVAQRGQRLPAECRKEVVQDGQELSYGSDAKQKLDYFAVTGKSEAPLVVYIHGGGWSIGDKSRGADTKSKYYNSLGYAIASFLAALG